MWNTYSKSLGILVMVHFLLTEGMDCIQINNFQVWKNLDYGIYYNNLVSSVIEGIKAADNGVNIFQFIIGPAAVQHQYENKFAEVFDSLIVGTSDAFDCSTDVPNTNDCNIKLSKQSRSHSPRRLGITMPTFSSGGNKAPEKPFAGIKAYQAIGGRGYLSGIIFYEKRNMKRSRDIFLDYVGTCTFNALIHVSYTEYA